MKSNKCYLKASEIRNLGLKLRQVNIGWQIKIQFRAIRESVLFIADITSVDEKFREGVKQNYKNLGLLVESISKNELGLYLDTSKYYCIDSCDYSCLEIMYSGAVLKYYAKTKGRLAVIRVEKSGYDLRSTENFRLKDPYALSIKRGYEWPELLEIRDIVESLGVVRLIRRNCEGDTYADWSNLYYPVIGGNDEILIFV